MTTHGVLESSGKGDSFSMGNVMMILKVFQDELKERASKNYNPYDYVYDMEPETKDVLDFRWDED